MEIFLLVVHVLVCVVLILVILMQPGRSGGLSGGAFGGMGGGTSMFGGGGAVPFLAKVTTYVGIIFALTCIGLWYAGRTTDSAPSTAAERLMEQGQVPTQQIPQPLVFPQNETTPAEGTTQTVPADSSSTAP